MGLSLQLPLATKVQCHAGTFDLDECTKAKLRLPKGLGDVHVLRLNGELVTWNKTHLLGKGAFAACYVGMRSPEAGGLATPCVVRSRIYAPEVDVDALAAAQNGLDAGTVTAMAEGAVAREDAIGARVSPALYNDATGVCLTRKPARGGRRALTVGPLLSGDFQQLFDAAARNDVPAAEVLTHFLRHIAPKLAAMHGRFIHNDLKANNFLFAWNGQRLSYEIADFGFANVLPTAAAEDLCYRIPEGSGGDCCERNALNGAEESLAGVTDAPGSDIFSLGIMSLQLLTGEHPFGFLTCQAATMDPEERLKIFDAFEACRPKGGAVSTSDGTPLQERFCAMWQEVRGTSPSHLVDLISAMVARTHAVRFTAEGCVVEPLEFKRPTAQEIGHTLQQQPLARAAVERLNAVAKELACEEGKPTPRRQALASARAQHAFLTAALTEEG